MGARIVIWKNLIIRNASYDSLIDNPVKFIIL